MSIVLMLLKALFKYVVLPLIVAMTIYIGYDVYGFRGRSVDYDDSKITLGPKDENYKVNDDISYVITKVDEENLQITIQNNSLNPYYFWMYEDEGWEDSLDANTLITYASRPTIYLGNRMIDEQNYARFDCGSGLGVNVIRPLESFRAVRKAESFYKRIGVRNFVRQGNNNVLINKINGEKYNSTAYQEEVIDDILQQVDSFSIQFNLPVLSYFGYVHSYAVSNTIVIGSKEIFQ